MKQWSNKYHKALLRNTSGSCWNQSPPSDRQHASCSTCWRLGQITTKLTLRMSSLQKVLLARSRARESQALERHVDCAFLCMHEFESPAYIITVLLDLDHHLISVRISLSTLFCCATYPLVMPFQLQRYLVDSMTNESLSVAVKQARGGFWGERYTQPTVIPTG